MADRPRNDGSADDNPEFGWLYGANKPTSDRPEPTRPVPRQQRPDAPDATRVMRTQPRNEGQQPPGPRGQQPAPTAHLPLDPRPVPQPAPTPPGSTPSGGRGGSRFRRPRFWFRLVLLLLVLWLVFTIATPFIAWNKGEPMAFEPSGDRPAEQPGTTYLMVGSDSRAGLSKAERKRLSTGNAGSSLTDTIMIMHTGSGPNLLMSIPRDSLVEVPGHGVSKINSAYPRGGPELLVQTIEQATGIRIDEYVEIGMGGVVGVVDAVGGIEVCPDKRIKDPLAGLNIKKGCQEVDGRVALAYARSRKESQLGDIDRARRQREVVSAVGKKVLSPWTVVNSVRWWNLNNSVPDFFVFGDGTGPTDAARWALALTKVNGDDGLTCGVPIADLAVNWDKERSQRLFDTIIEDKTDSIGKDLCTASGLPDQE